MAPTEENELQVIGLIQCISGQAFQPNQNTRTGMEQAQTEARSQALFGFDVLDSAEEGCQAFVIEGRRGLRSI